MAKKTKNTDTPANESLEQTNDFSDLFANIQSAQVENVSGILFNSDGSYALKLSQTLLQLMRMVQEWWELVLSLKRASDNFLKTRLEAKLAKEENGLVVELDPERVVIDATIVAKHAFDKYGRALAEGMTCPVCGKKVKYLGMGGYCSTECVLTDAKNKAMAFLMAPNDKYKDFLVCIEELMKVLDLTTLLINAVAMIPDILRELASFPEEYRLFVKQKIVEGFCELKVLISKAMIKKNELIKKMMRPIKLGVIAKPIAAVFTAILAVQNAMAVALDAFDKAYGIVMSIINNLKLPMGPNLALSAESFGWLCTPRSYISPLPYTSPSASKIIVELPGGSGLLSVLLTKPLCPSGMENVNFAAIEEIILSCFPPLTPVDFYLEPELFEIRYLFSDLSDLVSLIRLQLTDLLTGGPDYIPTFENLFPVKKYKNFTIGTKNLGDIWLPNIGYLWFLLGLMDAWAPRSLGLVGSMLNPAL